MRKLILPVCCLSALLCVSCSRPQDNAASAKFQRQANIKKYVQKAREINRLGEEREKELVIIDPVDPARLTNQAQETDTTFLSRLFERSRQSLEKRLAQTYSQQVSSQLSTFFEQQRQETLEAAHNAASPDDLARSLRALRAKQDEQWQSFITSQSGKVRIQPSQQLLEEMQKRVSRRCDEFMDRLAFYYGPDAAAKSRPVLNKAVEDFTYALASASTSEELDNSLAQIQQQFSVQIKQIAAQSGDPLGVTPEEVITSLRADMINNHRVLEERVETLYGKDAVLQARGVFNHCLEETGKTLRENARLSQKKRALTHLNQHYKHNLLTLQKRWNEDIQRQTQRPPTYVLSSR